ncbi:hypothetical protein ACFQ4C_30155 [Larkinella insperata]|uniref:Uncharacterized protein n=1 Tax=Larkinella insperata TaxID=332158 RepID=A0ABW3QLM9_9BACT
MIKNYLSAGLVYSLLLVPGYAQKLVATTDVPLTNFVRLPFPVELVSFGLNPDGGLRYQTGMAVSDRPAATTDAAKPRGAMASPTGTYIYSGGIDASAQALAGSGLVYARFTPRVQIPPETPVD